jgi:selenium metabolism protein YedF
MSVNPDLILLLKSAQLGHGEPDLGEKLMESFLKTLDESINIPSAIICVNSAVYLTTMESEPSRILKNFEAKGSHIFSCSTCLEYYKRRDKLIIGQPTNMREIVEILSKAKKIISL